MITWVFYTASLAFAAFSALAFFTDFDLQKGQLFSRGRLIAIGIIASTITVIISEWLRSQDNALIVRNRHSEIMESIWRSTWAFRTSDLSVRVKYEFEPDIGYASQDKDAFELANPSISLKVIPNQEAIYDVANVKSLTSNSAIVFDNIVSGWDSGFHNTQIKSTSHLFDDFWGETEGLDNLKDWNGAQLSASMSVYDGGLAVSWLKERYSSILLEMVNSKYADKKPSRFFDSVDARNDSALVLPVAAHMEVYLRGNKMGTSVGRLIEIHHSMPEIPMLDELDNNEAWITGEFVPIVIPADSFPEYPIVEWPDSRWHWIVMNMLGWICFTVTVFAFIGWVINLRFMEIQRCVRCLWRIVRSLASILL